jgi:hypothetical protein
MGAALVLAVAACAGLEDESGHPCPCAGGVPTLEKVRSESEALLLRGQAGDQFADSEVGRRAFTEIEPREIVPDKVNIPGGVTVDRTVSPGRAYVWDGGNNRILGFDLGGCYAEPVGTRCSPSLIFGQPSGTDYGACNLDSTAQLFPNRPAASASTLCGIRETTHTVLEDKSFANMFVDASGDLWVPDVMNNRVLEYTSPFATGSTVAGAVWGQADFTGNLCNGNSNGLASWLAVPNPTAATLCFWDPNGVGVGAGVRLDALGNLWVADGGNNRVLRFPKVNGVLSKTADIELGQSPVSFASPTAGNAMTQMSSPNAVLFDSNGNLYVADSGNARVLVFAPANGTFTSGQAAASTFGTFPAGNYLWVSQPNVNRVFRVRGPLTSSPVVDVILGQTSTSGASCNRGGPADLTTLCNPGALSVDRKGNLWVSDHFIELEGNFRLLMFAASTFPAAPTSVVYAPAATKEFPNNNPLLTYSMATFEPAFDSCSTRTADG